MPYPRPTLTQLRTQSRSQLISLVGALLRFSNLGILADIFSGLVNGLYGYLDRIALNATPFTAVDLEYIAGWAALKGIFQKQPQQAAFQASFPASAPAVIPAGTQVVRVIDGVTFTTAADAPVNGAVCTPTVVADQAGASGNTAVGTALVLGSSLTGVQSQGTAASATAVGVDLEDSTVFRTRMLQAYSQPAEGGSVTDYVNCTEAVAGVTRAWVAPQGMGSGTVSVYFMMDSAEAAFGGFPQGNNGVAVAEPRDTAATGDQLAVANSVFGKCNVNALVYSCAPSSNTIGLSMSGLTNASSTVKAAIDAAVAAVFLANGSPGGVRLPNNAEGGLIELDDIQTAIASVSGSAGYVITALTASAGSASPTSNITSNFGCLPVFNGASFL